jgi:hypothetical protein
MIPRGGTPDRCTYKDGRDADRSRNRTREDTKQSKSQDATHDLQRTRRRSKGNGRPSLLRSVCRRLGLLNTLLRNFRESKRIDLGDYWVARDRGRAFSDRVRAGESAWLGSQGRARLRNCWCVSASEPRRSEQSYQRKRYCYLRSRSHEPPPKTSHLRWVLSNGRAYP